MASIHTNSVLAGAVEGGREGGMVQKEKKTLDIAIHVPDSVLLEISLRPLECSTQEGMIGNNSSDAYHT